MGSAAMISSKFIGKSSLTKRNTRNAWAAYVRNRFPANSLHEIEAEWNLTEWEARSLLYAQASQTTLDKILDHKNGGPLLALDLLCLRFSTTMEGLAQKLEEDAEDDRIRREAEEQSQRRVASRLSVVRSFHEEE